MMMDSVRRLAVSDQSLRRKVLKEILTESGLSHRVQHAREGTHEIENIVLSFGEAGKRLVFGAHYDSVTSSTGANDNASGVCILIELAKHLRQHHVSGIEIVFFDREEAEDHGSSAYIRLTGKENLAAMVNLDMCGFGDRIAMISKFRRNDPLFRGLMDDGLLKKHRIICLDRVPFLVSDDVRFDEAGIPNIALETIADEEEPLLQEIARCAVCGQPLSDELRKKMRSTVSASTFHNGPNDSIHSVHEECMMMVLDYLLDGLQLSN